MEFSVSGLYGHGTYRADELPARDRVHTRGGSMARPSINLGLGVAIGVVIGLVLDNPAWELG